MRGQNENRATKPRRQRQMKSERTHLRFQINGVVHNAIDWSLDGFSAKATPETNVHTGDAFLVSGIGCGSLDMVPVFLRGEAVRVDETEVSVRFLHVSEKDRSALQDFLIRSEALNQSSAA